jgi:NDP-sugar pyrophosphorylase family protein
LIETAVISAIGNSAHTSQLTYNRPRAMLPALGKPLVVRLMDRLYRVGIRKYIVIVGENEGEVASYLSTHWVPNVTIEFVLKLNSSSLLRTLVDVTRQIGKPFLVTTYNSFTHGQFPATLLKQYEQNNKGELMLSGAATTLSRTGKRIYMMIDKQRITELDREVSSGKQPYMLSELAICGQDFVDFMGNYTERAGAFNKNLIDIFQTYIRSGGAASLTETAWTLPIESDFDLLTLNRHLLDDAQDAHILSELHWTVQIVPPVRVDPQVSVGQGAKIGPHVYLERGSSVGYEAAVRNTMVLQQAAVAPAEKVSDCIVFSRGRITS